MYESSGKSRNHLVWSTKSTNHKQWKGSASYWQFQKSKSKKRPAKAAADQEPPWEAKNCGQEVAEVIKRKAAEAESRDREVDEVSSKQHWHQEEGKISVKKSQNEKSTKVMEMESRSREADELENHDQGETDEVANRGPLTAVVAKQIPKRCSDGEAAPEAGARTTSVEKSRK
ncbi:unnamed protein product [Nippostrongylus brasiliensis]|uniref:Hva1_TUDOR domain-containing protein n=1 Tax=Nippostrongylus brasiliensis TaxID=27835 RepID=A0A0N4Y2B3_NIPBR|nr:unnamed protein product [Nippostrongylus brasiliensis]